MFKPIDTSGKDALPSIYQGLLSEMQALRSTEFHVVALFFTVSGIVFSGNMLLLTQQEPWLVSLAVIIASSVYMNSFRKRTIERIIRDHKTYGLLGSGVKQIREYWKIEVEDTSGGKFGCGPGAMSHVSMVNITALFVMIVLPVAMVLHYAPQILALLCCIRGSGHVM